MRVTSAGQRDDSLAFIPLMGRLKIARRAPGRPRTRPGRVLADKAYSSAAIRSHLRRRRIRANPPTRSATGATGAAGAAGRPPSTPRPTSSATSSSAPSAGSASTAPSPPGTTSATSPAAAPSTSQRSGSGSATSPNKIYGTRPSRISPDQREVLAQLLPGEGEVDVVQLYGDRPNIGPFWTVCESTSGRHARPSSA